MTTTELLNIIDKNSDLKIDEILHKIPNVSFVDYLNSLMTIYSFTRSEIINKTILNRNYAYQIFDGSKKPSKDKVIQIALALGLTLHQTNNLLTLSDNGILYAKVKKDFLIIYGLKHRMSVTEVNLLLDEHHLDILE